MPRQDLLRRTYHTAMARRAIPAILPTIPPAIAPIGVELAVTIGTLLDVIVEEGTRPDVIVEEGTRLDVIVEEGTLRVVLTPELLPPAAGVTRKKSRMNGSVKLAVVTVMSIS